MRQNSSYLQTPDLGELSLIEGKFGKGMFKSLLSSKDHVFSLSPTFFRCLNPGGNRQQQDVVSC